MLRLAGLICIMNNQLMRGGVSILFHPVSSRPCYQLFTACCKFNKQHKLCVSLCGQQHSSRWVILTNCTFDSHFWNLARLLPCKLTEQKIKAMPQWELFFLLQQFIWRSTLLINRLPGMTVLILYQLYCCKIQLRRFKEAIMAQGTTMIYFPYTLMGAISLPNGETRNGNVMQGL